MLSRKGPKLAGSSWLPSAWFQLWPHFFFHLTETIDICDRDRSWQTAAPDVHAILSVDKRTKDTTEWCLWYDNMFCAESSQSNA